MVGVELDITTTALPDAVGGEPYSATLLADGGVAPLTSTTAGTMPAGLTGPATQTGIISGTPNPVCATATSVMSFQVSDSDTPPAIDTQTGLGITVEAVDLVMTTDAMPDGIVGVPYSAFVEPARRATLQLRKYRHPAHSIRPD